MSLQITPATEPTPETNPYADLPASAFPEGMTAEDYAAKLVAPEGEAEKPAAEKPAEGAADKPVRPDHVPEKFWNAETGQINTDALLKSYKEMEDAKRNPKPAIETPEAGAEEANADKPAPLAEVFTEFTTAFEANNGDVSDDIIAKMVAAGVPAYAIETWKVGYQVQANEPYEIAHKVAGGQEAFDAAMAWAERGLSEAEIASFNAAADNRNTIGLAVENLMTKYRAAHPSEGRFVQAQSASSHGDVFRSHAEMMAAIKAPNYSDPAVQQDILAKIARSKEAGTL